MYILPEEKNNATNGSNVFDFYDDFNNGVVDSWWTVEHNAQWTESNGVIYSNPDASFAVKPLRINIGTFDNVIIEARGGWTFTNDDLGIFVYGDSLGNAYALWHVYGTPPNSQYCIAQYTSYGSPTFLNCYAYDLPQGVWGRFKVLIKNNGEIYGKIWDESSQEPPWTISYTVTPYGKYVGVLYWDDNCYVEFDWIRVRKYADQEPTYNISFGYVQIEIPFVFETSEGFNNTDIPSTNTTIWAKVKYLPANQNTTIYVYYGNPNALPENYTCKDIFLFCDEFNTYNPIWSWPSNWTIEYGKLK